LTCALPFKSELNLNSTFETYYYLISFKYNENGLEFLFGTEVFGFCALMKAFLSGIAIAMVREEDEIRVLNVKIVGKREAQDELNIKSINKKLNGFI